MKKIVFILSITITLLACTSTDKKSGDASNNSDSTQQAEKAKIMSDTANFTSIQWLDSTFLSKNIGTKPLVIANVTASCGCTIPETPQQPFAPGEEGVIKAKFDSKGRVGEQRKHISVDANTTPSRAHDLEFTVDVKK